MLGQQIDGEDGSAMHSLQKARKTSGKSSSPSIHLASSASLLTLHMIYVYTSLATQDWEWCLSHLSNVVLLAGFGINIDRNKAPYAPSREIFDLLTKTLESINKSPNAKVRR